MFFKQIFTTNTKGLGEILQEKGYYGIANIIEMGSTETSVDWFGFLAISVMKFR